MKVQSVKEAFIAALVIFLVVKLVALIPLKAEFTRPIKQELDDFDIYDLFYAGKDKEHPGEKDPNIILVQTENARDSIAKQIGMIESLHPAVIGIDLSFRGPKEPVSDQKLLKAIMDNERIVPGYSLEPDSLTIVEQFIPQDYLQLHGGYMNFASADSLSVIRTFNPFADGKIFSAFSTRVAALFSPASVQLLMKRNKVSEDIIYFGGLPHYLNYSAADFKKYYEAHQLEKFKGKIILLGSFSADKNTPGNLEDLKFSPLNLKMNGKSFPDNYGVVIHANIISMILDTHSYIHAPNSWLTNLLVFFTCFGMVGWVLHCYRVRAHPSHIGFFMVQVAASLLLIFLFLLLYDWFTLKINPLSFILAIILSVEMFELYSMLARWLNHTMNYKTIFAKHP